MLNCIGIDDEYSCNALLEDYCSRLKFINLAATFTDPYLAIPILESGIIDLAFIDFNMGEIDAPAFLEYVPKSVQVIIVSSELKSRIEEYKMPISEILSKPFSFEQFEATMTRFNNHHKNI